MSRIPTLDNPTGKAAELLDMVQKKLGRTPNMMKTLAQAPAVLEMYLGMSGALGGATLSAKDRERIALLAAQRNSCNYCAKAHTAIGKMAGLTDAEISEASSGRASGSPKSEAILKIADTILTKNGTVADAELAAARKAGVTDAELLEIVAVTSLNIFTNYVNHLADPVVDF